MAALILHQDLRPIAFALAVLAAYLSANGLLGSRSSPPTFFTVALILAGIALRPTLQLSFIAAASAIFVTIFFALDYIVRLVELRSASPGEELTQLCTARRLLLQRSHRQHLASAWQADRPRVPFEMHTLRAGMVDHARS